ncbi:MAG: DUF1638 domain-containing protein [Luminiphilus sp.]|jgi:hypothetical protein|nr:DUF1638 domain-containing protein [Luminiphilus sp.]
MPASILVIACGALAREIEALKIANEWEHVDLQCIDAALHNRPGDIPGRVETLLMQSAGQYDHRFVAYADCGTGGRLDAVLQRWQVERLPGAHCYEFYATSTVFQTLAEAEPGTFYLTDFLARHFERLVIEDFKLNTHPELRDTLFAHYTRVIYLAQTDSAQLMEKARRAAAFLALPLEVVSTGMGDLETAIASQVLRLQETPGVGHAAH